MLKAAIVYVQGSGGNLLSRTLSLSEQTIALVPKELATEQPALQLTATERYCLYNNWNSNDWTSSEKNIGMWYHSGDQDFVNYELSCLGLIDQFHPKQFEYESSQQILWNSISAWQNLIFIKYRAENQDKIIKLAEIKRPDHLHRIQILNNELTAFDTLTNTYSGLIVNWEDMQKCNSYIECVDNLSRQLELTIDLNLVKKLWTSWKIETDKILEKYE